MRTEQFVIDDAGEPGNFPQRFGNYLLLGRVGDGGMGLVYLATHGADPNVQKRCVVKTLRAALSADKEYVARFIDEARLVVQLSHRNICQVFDVGRVGTQHYLAMEHVDGRDLTTVQHRLADRGSHLDENLALHIMLEVLDALDYAHRKVGPDGPDGKALGLVHRDVSPDNIMINFEGEVKLIDFGVATSNIQAAHTRPNTVLGKIAYMAPEQARGEPVDGRTDLFVAAIVAYELLTRERYYGQLTPQQICLRVGSGRHVPSRLSVLPAPLRAILRRALSPEPADRPATCADFRDALEQVLQQRGVRGGGRALRKLMVGLFADGLRRAPPPAPVTGTLELDLGSAEHTEMHVSADDDVDLVIELGVDGEAMATAIARRVDEGDIKVPPFPKAVMELNHLVAQEAGFDAFVDVIARDPALAARVLRVANSAGNGTKEPVTTLARAVRSLGTSMLVRIALADSVMAHACRDGLLVAHKDRAWRQAVTSALLTSVLAPLRALPAEQVFVCGLLHDFGRLVAVQVIEEIIGDGRVLCLDELSDQVWTELIELHHIRLGEIVAESWLLPDVIVECITTHHDSVLVGPNSHVVQLLVGIDDVIKLLENEPSPTKDQVAAVSRLSEDEVAVVHQALSSLPQLIASFTIERLGRPRESKTVAKPAVATAATPGAPRIKAVALSSNRCFDVVGMTAKSVILDGAVGLAQHQVFRVRFELPFPLELWLRVTDNQSVDGRIRVSAVPFALTDADARAWQSQTQAASSV